MSVIYYEEDANPAVLQNRVIAVIGYTELGRAFALNLRDAGLPILVTGEMADQEKGQADGFTSGPIAEVIAQSHILVIALPYETMSRLYIEQISPCLRRGYTLIFVNAFNLAYGYVEPPPFVDVGVIAPRVNGAVVRRNFENGDGFLSFVSVWQDASRQTWPTVLAIASAVGSLKVGAVEVNVEQEAQLSLFITQTILPVIQHLMTHAAELLMREGYPAEAVFSDLYLSGQFHDYMQQVTQTGLLGALKHLSSTDQYGLLTRLTRFEDLKLERLMEITLDEIRSGKFAQEWSQEFADGHPRLDRLLNLQTKQEFYELEQQTLEYFDPNALIDGEY